MEKENLKLEVQFGRLEERLNALEDKQDNHHETILFELRELKNNFAHRLEVVETKKLSASDFITFKMSEFKELKEAVDTLLRFRWMFAGIIAMAIFLAPFVWDYFKH